MHSIDKHVQHRNVKQTVFCLAIGLSPVMSLSQSVSLSMQKTAPCWQLGKCACMYVKCCNYSVGLLKSPNIFTAIKVIIVFIHKLFQLHPMCHLFFQMFRQNNLKYFIYFERYFMIFEFWGFVWVITSVVKCLLAHIWINISYFIMIFKYQTLTQN